MAAVIMVVVKRMKEKIGVMERSADLSDNGTS